MADNNFLTYKGRPLVRNKNVIYYGNMNDEYIIRLTVLSEENDIANKIKVELMLSDTAIEEAKRIKKDIVKENFYEAMDFAVVWLERYNKAE